MEDASKLCLLDFFPQLREKAMLSTLQSQLESFLFHFCLQTLDSAYSHSFKNTY